METTKPMTRTKAIALRLNRIMYEKNFSIGRYASMCDIPQSTLQKMLYERAAAPRLDTLGRLAKGLEMTLPEFLDFPEMYQVEF